VSCTGQMATTSVPTVASDEELTALLGTDAFIRSPFDVYRELLVRPGWRAPSGYRVFSRYAHILAILRDPDTFGQTTRVNPSFHEMDPPQHTRLRRLVARAFTPRSAAAQVASIERAVAELLSTLRSGGRMNLVTELAVPMPAMVIAELLGVPYSDAELWRSWMEPIKESRGVVHYLAIDPAEKARLDERAATAGRQAADYLHRLIGERKQSLGADVVSRLIEAREVDDSLTDDEVLFVLFTILAAGLHTTASQLSNTVRALLEHPGTLDALRQDPDLVDNAVEESLRFDGALQAEHRVVRADTELGGVDLVQGERVLIINGAANRDPEVFAEPDRFDILRGNAKNHLTFGWGIHRCLGAALAKNELVVAVQRIAADLPDLRLAGPPVQHRFDRWRGLSELDVAWTVHP
jgi:cytochrome P450